MPELQVDSLSTISPHIKEAIVTPSNDDDGVLGMSRDTISSTDPVAVAEPTPTLSEQIIEHSLEVSALQLFQGSNLKALLELPNDPEAQYYAYILSLNTLKHFNVHSLIDPLNLQRISIDLIANRIGLTAEEVDQYKKNLEIVTNLFEQLRQIKLYQKGLKENGKDLTEEQQEYTNTLLVEIVQTLRVLHMPAKKRLLSNPAVLEQEKENVIESFFRSSEGVSTNDQQIDAEEDSLMRDLYADSSTSEGLKSLIKYVVKNRVAYEPQALTVIPREEVLSVDALAAEVFRSLAVSKLTSAEDFETIIAPYFFPDKDAKKLMKAWSTLSKVKLFTLAPDFFLGTNVLRVFAEYAENAELLSPLVEMLAKYDFQYIPTYKSHGYRSYAPEYIDRLKVLAQDVNSLEQELKAIKDLYPNFRYSITVDSERNPVTRTEQIEVMDNPYAIAIGLHYEDKGSDRSAEDPTLFLQNLESVQHLYEVTPAKYKDGTCRVLLERLLQDGSGYNNNSRADTNLQLIKPIVEFANTVINDPNITDETLQLRGSKYFQMSLRPETENIEALFKFLVWHIDKVALYSDNQRQSDPSKTWHQFVLGAGDLYRYQLTGMMDEEQIVKGRVDFEFALQALSNISDTTLRDQALEHLSIAFTDPDYRDLITAKELTSFIVNAQIRERVEQLILLEIEREQLGETNGWKKAQLVKRASPESIALLKAVLKFDGSDGLEAREKFTEKTGESDIHAAAATPELAGQLPVEIERIKAEVAVTINVTWARVKQLLEHGTFFSIWENQEVMKERSEYSKSKGYSYIKKRESVERKMNNKAKGGARDPHPIYGAMFSPNGRDEFMGGAGGGYGECFIKLKTDAIKDKTTFTYDDSFNGFTDFPLTWDDATTAKAMLNLTNHGSRHGYVEAQILGGLTISDIDTIYIPDIPAGKENNQGYKVYGNVQQEVELLRRQHPQINFEIVQVPEALLRKAAT